LAMNCEESLFSSEDRDKILEQFKGVKELFEKKFEPRKIMDKAILDMLGIEAEKQDKLLEKLYPALLKEIAILKGMMQ